MKLIKNASGKKVAKMSKREWTDIGIKQGWFKTAQNNSSEPKWRTGKVFTKAPGFGNEKEVQENKIITIRPEENEAMALKREGFDPSQSRIEIIDM